MDQPGFSLFQGTESIFVDGRGAEEEDEELLDQKRRENELGQQLQNAFDDLLDEADNDDTMDNSYRSGTSYQSQAVDTGRLNYAGNGGSSGADENTIYRLKIELESKTNELTHVNRVLAEERQKGQKQIGDLTKRLALAEAECERAQMMRNQEHELLVESKTKICDLDDLVEKLKERNRLLEAEKSELAVELENVRIMVNDAQMKCHLMEKEVSRGGAANQSNRNQDAAFRQLTERNNAQLDVLQQQIDNFRDRLDAKEGELRTLEAKYRDLQKTREVMLIEKSDVINGLTERLEQAQRQCQELLDKQTTQQRTEAEAGHWRAKINGLEERNRDLQKTTDSLLKQLDEQRTRRDDFANVMESTPHMRKKPHLAMQGLEQTDALAREVVVLKQEVANKTTEVKHLIIRESQLREQIRELEQQQQLTRSPQMNTSGCGDWQNVITEQRQRIEALQREKEEMTAAVDNERQKMKEITANSLKCMQQMKQATEIEVKNMQLQTNCMDYLKNLRGLRAASQLLDGLTESRTTSTNTSPSKKTYCDRSVMVSTPMNSSACNTVATTSTDLSSPQRTAIIEEYAKLSAVEIKRVEDKYREKLMDTQEVLAEYQREIKELRRQHIEETEMFKEAILAEREEYERLLAEREDQVEKLETRVRMLEQKGVRDETEEELLASLEQELRKKQEEIDEERHSMQIWRNQWKEERKQMLAIEAHLKKEMTELRANWKCAKSTAANYKKYTEEKDKFINREIERMRMEYEGVIEKLRQRTKRPDMGFSRV